MSRAAVLAWAGALACIGAIFGLGLAHVLELPGKLRLDGPLWLAIQQNLYVGFGAFAAVIEPLGIALAWAFVLLARGRERRVGIFAAACVSVGLAVWVSVVAPMNARLNGWNAATLPPDWTATRDQWELGHALHAALFAAAGAALIGLAASWRRRGAPGGE